jgi:DNA primase
MDIIPRLHPDTIEQVKQAADIVEIVSEHVVLRKQGRDLVGSCPFHEDRSPSFSVSATKQFYYCFGCGAGGNAVKFLMELGKRSFSEVVLELAQKYNVPVQTLEGSQRQALEQKLSRREKILEILALTAQFYQHALRQNEGKHALTYLQQKRQLQPETIQDFQLGYSPGGWQALHDYLVDQKAYDVEMVEAAGLILPRRGGGGYYDRFRDRLMIPIHDLQGRIVGFGSRTLTNEEPKYLNSPETEVFNKGKVLFGLDKAKAAIAKQDRAIVVEGYFDVIALHAANITNAVASMGTALSQDQMRQLLRYSESKQIILNFDADAAGNKAAERAIGEIEALAYRGEVQLRVLNIPSGKDADEYLRDATTEDYQTLVDEAPLWLDWQIQGALKGRDLRQTEEFQGAIQQVVKLLGNLPNATLRTHYIHRCAGLLSNGDSRQALRLEEDLRTQVQGQRWHGRSQKWQRSSDVTLRMSAEEQLLRIYLHCPDQRLAIRQAIWSRLEKDDPFAMSQHRFLWQQIIILEAEAFRMLFPEHPDQVEDLDPEQFPADELLELDLIKAIKDLAPEDTNDIQRLKLIYPLLNLDETAEIQLLRPVLVIRAATASLERMTVEKRCRYYLDALTKQAQSIFKDKDKNQSLTQYLQNLQTALDNDTALAENLSEEESLCLKELDNLQRNFYQEKRYLQQLDQQRHVNLDDLSQAPIIDYSSQR